MNISIQMDKIIKYINTMEYHHMIVAISFIHSGLVWLQVSYFKQEPILILPFENQLVLVFNRLLGVTLTWLERKSAVTPALYG